MRSSAAPWCEALWKPVSMPLQRIDAAGGVASELEREHARRVRLERQHLQVEHQLDVLVERVGHAGRRARAARAASPLRLRASMREMRCSISRMLLAY